jgi:hypothetical protein
MVALSDLTTLPLASATCLDGFMSLGYKMIGDFGGAVTTEIVFFCGREVNRSHSSATDRLKCVMMSPVRNLVSLF